MKTREYCCNELEAYGSRVQVYSDGSIQLQDYDGEDAFQNIKFCPFCGKEIVITETKDDWSNM